MHAPMHVELDLYATASVHGSSAFVGVRLNKNPAEPAAAKIVPPPKMFKKLRLWFYYDFVLIYEIVTNKFIHPNEKKRLFWRSLL